VKRRVRVLILGAGGRDYHNFNVYFRDNPDYEVVAFTAAQIPGISGRRYPPELAGELYPSGIPVVSEEEAEEIIKSYGVDLVVLAYSDLTYQDVGRLLSMALASGASFLILGPRDTMIKSSKPVIAVTAVRTGAGKSSVSREIARLLIERGFKVAPIRHPMAYGPLLPERAVQVFKDIDDLDRMGVTLEEREEYEAYIKMGLRVYAGIDYGKVLSTAEREAEIILWDGGNNDFPFIKPDLMVTVLDALRPGQEIASFPGEVNVRMAEYAIINKVDQASKRGINSIISNVKSINPKAKISLAESEVYVDSPEAIKGKRVVVVEDAPTVTHGQAPYGAGYVAAIKYGASEVVDPRPYAKGIISSVYNQYKHIARVIPTLGYTPDQIKDLEDTLNSIPADAIISSSPIDIERVLNLNKPVIKVRYRVKIVEGPTLNDIVEDFLSRVSYKLDK